MRLSSCIILNRLPRAAFGVRLNLCTILGSSRNAFTLVELLMVLSVLVVLTAMSLPATLRWQRGLAMERAISIIQIQVQETRLAAIRSGEPWSLVLPQPGVPGRRYPNHLPAAHNATWDFQWPAGIQCHDLPSQQFPGPIFFQPDGTVSERFLRLADSNGQSTFLQIDRLTGSASIHEEPKPATGSHQTAHRNMGLAPPMQNHTLDAVPDAFTDEETGALSC
jgi:prepilin-type N-terminal cleavage/methylation domain-containing protein